MPVRIFAIPFVSEKGCFFDEEVNNFCLNKKVRKMETYFFQSDGKPYWTILIEYNEVLKDEKTPDVNLDEPEKLLYQRFKEWRKNKAEADGVPVYIIATNSEIMELIKRTPKSLEALRSIRGFGKKKIEKYGKEIIDIINNFYPDKK
ncbi:MAG: HRDC domain-containing protein [Nitrospirae bacterium]|nr:HRDC domain-containing protein [Nitrospirota bacterium]